MAKGKKHVIGMHEFKLQMQIPEMLCDVYAYYLGEAKAWKAVQAAKLYHSDEAVTVGLVDESVEVEAVIPRAEAYLQTLMQLHPKVFFQSKLYFRKQLYKLVMNGNLQRLAEDIAKFNSDPELVAMVKVFVESLTKKRWAVSKI